MKQIVACLYAVIDYRDSTTSYGVYTVLPHNKKETVRSSVYKHPIEIGLWDGVVGSGVCWAEGPYASMKELVVAIAEGVAKHQITEFDFTFEHPDYISASFFASKGSKVYSPFDNILTRERPLNEDERQEFVRALIALPRSKD